MDMDQRKGVHAFCNDALGDSDAVALAQRLRAGEVSPLEVAEAAIARAETVNPLIHAVELPCYERARSEAALISTACFAGVPTFVKDNTDVAGLPTNHGSAAVDAGPAEHNDPFAEQYLQQGFTLLGKSTLPEFGLSATTEFAHREPSRNPWNLDYSTGASSGGSAALVAAGVVPIAHANDGGGSIRIPAACCGLVGLKASRGRHRDKPATRYLPVNLISEGVLTRSVRDTAVFHAEAETYFRNTKLPPIGLAEGPGTRRLRVGLWLESVTGDEIDAVTRNTVEETARLLEGLGHRMEPIAVPLKYSFVEDFGLYWSLLAFLFEKTGHRTVDASFDADLIDGLTRGLSNQFKRKFYKSPQFIWRLRRTYKEYAQVFENLDVVLSPVLSHTTPLLGHISPTVEFEELFSRLMRYVGFTPWANASGGPAISLPAGVTDNNLPLSVQLFANHGQERTLLEMAYEIEAARPWKSIRDYSMTSGG
jgi:amidase